jgi:hypothetical protein
MVFLNSEQGEYFLAEEPEAATQMIMMQGS